MAHSGYSSASVAPSVGRIIETRRTSRHQRDHWRVATERTRPESADLTYDYLRLMLMFPVGLIAVSSLLEAWLVTHHFRDSISDYYQSPIRDLFVGGLMASAVCLIAYKGDSKLEDYALNFAGFNAFFVALVPNNLTEVLRQADISGPVGLLQTRSEIVSNLRISLSSLLVLALFFVVMDWRVMHWTPFDWDSQQLPSRIIVVTSWVAEIAFIFGVLAMLLGHESFFGKSSYGLVHFGGATLLIANLSFAVASHAWPEKLRIQSPHVTEPLVPPVAAATDPGEAQAAVLVAAAPDQIPFYRIVVALMWAGLIIGGICIASDKPYSVIVTEYYEIILFVVFWSRATRASWVPVRHRDRRGRPA